MTEDFNNMNSNSYDEVPYPSNVFKPTQPDKLATIATLFGMQPPAIEQCRVLELGCASGNNLIAMAQAMPDSQFIGIDLSKRQVEYGQNNIRYLGLKNITLKQMNIMAIDHQLGMFDYIVAHGVYSWVPPPVQDKLLQICHDNLVHQGVAYVSYNIYPGWYINGMVREMMLYHTQQFATSPEKIEQARALINFLVESTQDDNDFYSSALKTKLDSLNQKPDSYLLHEHLEENNIPTFFYQFIEQAEKHQLQYLSDTELSIMFAANFPRKIAETLRMSGDQVRQEQYTDFLLNRAFRQTLLCHQDISLNRILKPEIIRNFYIVAPIQPYSSLPNLNDQILENFKILGNDKITLSTESSIAKAVCLCLGESWPQSLSYNDLMQQAYARLGVDIKPNQITEAVNNNISTFLLELSVKSNKVEFHTRLENFTLTISEYPLASPLTRLQIQQQAPVTNLRHDNCNLDSLTRYLLPYLDGNHNKTMLVDTVLAAIKKGEMTVRMEKDNQTITDPEKLHSYAANYVKVVLENLSKNAFLMA